MSFEFSMVTANEGKSAQVKINKNGESIKLVHFGTLSVRKKSPRKGRNPRTGETMEISSRSMVSFKPSKGLRMKVNS